MRIIPKGEIITLVYNGVVFLIALGGKRNITTQDIFIKVHVSPCRFRNDQPRENEKYSRRFKREFDIKRKIVYVTLTL